MIYDIIFINPPNHSTSYYYPIGLGLLSEICSQNKITNFVLDYQTIILNSEINWPENFLSEFEKDIENYDSNLFAFSVMNVGFPWAIEMAKIIKRIKPECKIIFGGPHITLLKGEILHKYFSIDILAIFEGENIIVPLVNALLKPTYSDLCSVKNIIYRTNDKIIESTGSYYILKHNEIEPFIENLDRLPYLNIPPETLPEIDLLSVEAGRGCPFRCYFCSSHTLWTRKPRFKSPSRLLNEAEYYLNNLSSCQSNPVVSFEHDNFLASRRFLKEFAKEKINSKQSFLYSISGSINLLNKEIVDLLSDSGCASIFMGLETGSQRIQDISKKCLKVNTIIPKVKMVLNSEINVSANLIIGYPEETLEEVFETLLLSANLIFCGAKVNISLMCPEPGSQLYEQSISSDHLLLKNSSYYGELVRGGIVPEELDKTAVFYLYTLTNEHYNIELMAPFVQLIINSIEKFPLTFYQLIHHEKLSFSQFFDLLIQKKSWLLRKNYDNPLLVWDIVVATINTSDNCKKYMFFAEFEKQKWFRKHNIYHKSQFSFSVEDVAEYWDFRKKVYQIV